MALTLSNTITNGTTPDASEVQGNFDDIVNFLNAGIGTAYIADSAVTTAKIANESWTEFTPVWTNNGGVTTIGTGGAKGVLTGYYYQIGKIVVARFNLTWASGTGSSGGTDWQLSLPPAAQAGTNNWANLSIGTGYVYDSSTSQATPCTALLDLTNQRITPAVGVVSAAFIANTGLRNATPWTWATGDYVRISVCYEA